MRGHLPNEQHSVDTKSLSIVSSGRSSLRCFLNSSSGECQAGRSFLEPQTTPSLKARARQSLGQSVSPKKYCCQKALLLNIEVSFRNSLSWWLEVFIRVQEVRKSFLAVIKSLLKHGQKQPSANNRRETMKVDL